MVKVQVTQKHIDSGVACDCVGCPVALAVAEVMSPNFVAEVGAYNLRIGPVSETSRYIKGVQVLAGIPYPGSVRRFMDIFDGVNIYGKPEPFEFEIDIPQQYLKESV